MKRINICILGLNFGRHIVDEVTSKTGAPYFQLKAVCNMDREKVLALAAQHNVTAYTNFKDVLADASIPVIGLFRGPSERAQLIDRIISAGKDVMTTNPFETDTDATLTVLKKTKALGRVIHLNSPAPAGPEDLARVKQWQTQYDLGRPIAAGMKVLRAMAEAKRTGATVSV